MVTFASPPLLTQLHTCAWPWLWRKYWKNAPVRRPSLYSICSSYLPACNTGALTSRQPSPGYSLLSSRVYPPSMVDTVEGKLALLGIHPSTCPWFSCPDRSFASSFTLLPSQHLQFSPGGPMTPTQVLNIWSMISNTTCFLTEHQPVPNLHLWDWTILGPSLEVWKTRNHIARWCLLGLSVPPWDLRGTDLLCHLTFSLLSKGWQVWKCV